MVATPEIQSTQAAVRSLVAGVAANVDVGQTSVRVLMNFPTEEVRISQTSVRVVGKPSVDIEISQSVVRALVRGRIYNPKLRAWTYTLDGHDYYVLKLADDKTLVYDLLTEQWSWFSGTGAYWRPNTGKNWYSAGIVSQNYGSNVIAGDDTLGHLWVLNPEQGYDENPSVGMDHIRFPRVATGQVTVRQRKTLPVFQVYLTANAGAPVTTGDTVTLTYSDDLGNTFVDAGPISVTTGEFNQEFAWRSLGLITQAGRLLKITDDGAFARIEALDCSIGGVDG